MRQASGKVDGIVSDIGGSHRRMIWNNEVVNAMNIAITR